MDLSFNPKEAADYKSRSQKARRLTESWMEQNMFCPVCGQPHLGHYPNNRPVADFYCPNCASDFELKSRETCSNKLAEKVSDGAYDTMIARIQSCRNPHFFFLNYASNAVMDLWLVPNLFFTPAIIEMRKPLRETARRAGWTGCNILLDPIPDCGKIRIIKNAQVVPKEIVCANYKRTAVLFTENLESRGWALDVLACLERIPSDEFSLKDVYAFAEELQRKHPDNMFIQAKIRQQLQFLRDRGYLAFLGRGRYRKQ